MEIAYRKRQSLKIPQMQKIVIIVHKKKRMHCNMLWGNILLQYIIAIYYLQLFSTACRRRGTECIHFSQNSFESFADSSKKMLNFDLPAKITSSQKSKSFRKYSFANSLRFIIFCRLIILIVESLTFLRKYFLFP